MNPTAAVDPLSLILGEAPEALQLFKGIGDLISGNAFSKAVRPTSTTPQSVEEATALARSRAGSPLLPGYGLYKNDIEGNTATAAHNIIESGGSGGGTAGAFGTLSNNENDQMRKLQLEGINLQEKNQSSLITQLNTQGGYEKENWEYNQAQPYDYSQKAANTFTQGGFSELFNSIKGGGQTYMLLDMLKKLQGGGNNSTWGGGIQKNAGF